MGYFTRGEFEGGARALKATDAKSMKKAALGLEDEVAAPAPLLAFATFAFKYCLTVRSCLFSHTAARLATALFCCPGPPSLHACPPRAESNWLSAPELQHTAPVGQSTEADSVCALLAGCGLRCTEGVHAAANHVYAATRSASI